MHRNRNQRNFRYNTTETRNFEQNHWVKIQFFLCVFIIRSYYFSVQRKKNHCVRRYDLTFYLNTNELFMQRASAGAIAAVCLYMCIARKAYITIYTSPPCAHKLNKQILKNCDFFLLLFFFLPAAIATRYN